MKGNINNFLYKTLTTYTFLLVIVFILKIVGFNYFGLDLNNPIIIGLEYFLQSTKLIYIVDFITMYIMFYICFSIICERKNIKLLTFISTIIEFCCQIILLKIDKVNELKTIVDLVIFIVAPVFVNKKLKLKKPLIMFTLIVIYQLISYKIRGQNITANYSNKIVDLLLNIDQYIMLIITQKIYFMKGEIKICHQEVFSSLRKQISLKNLQKKLQKNLLNFNKQTKVEKITFIIYMTLYLIWNFFTLILILVIGVINDTIIECIFIITSFWLSKRTFGKPFHFQSMLKCFIVSNLTYYALNRITTPLGISIIVPIMLGVGLSYVTSKFVKTPVVKLYKGIPEDEFNNSILKVTDKDSLQYKICHMFYVERKSELEIAHNVGYSIDNIKKIKSKINKKIKELE